jgi:hypothetical protein
MADSVNLFVASYALAVGIFSNIFYSLLATRYSLLAHPKPVLLHTLFFAGLVAFGGATRPDPIPNSAVKRSSANGTMSQDLGE